jgi:hypothetical protein
LLTQLCCRLCLLSLNVPHKDAFAWSYRCAVTTSIPAYLAQLHQGAVIRKILGTILGEVMRSWEGIRDFLRHKEKLMWQKWRHVMWHFNNNASPLLKRFCHGKKVRHCKSLRFFGRLWGSPGPIVVFFGEGLGGYEVISGNYCFLRWFPKFS